MKNMKSKIGNGNCSICNQPYYGWGNNASPFSGKCCDDCNSMVVIPYRVAVAVSGKDVKAIKRQIKLDELLGIIKNH